VITFVNIFGYNVTYLELIGSVFNFIAVILATRANLWNWVFGTIAQICFFFLFWYTGLYANMILQVYFTYISLISIYKWNRTDESIHKGLMWMTNKKRIKTFIVTIICIIIGWFGLSNIGLLFPSLKSDYPLMDITIMVLSVTGVNLLSNKYIDTWLVWITIDVLSIILFFITGIYVIGIEYIIVTGIATYGFFNWKKIMS